ncbi:hypothetical protein B0H63DRAFT_19528 [Podospora didyma]|uniref:Uncharacterized protein n=1 Tax=Podospora didyma TaxID=330526 RepID=A0AAE0U7M1_9PEZI|nr:hypothetical protein B0H63DRAFT_19528 [Podospora didyma]
MHVPVIRIPVPVALGTGSYGGAALFKLRSRDGDDTSFKKPNTSSIVVAGVVVGIIVIIAAILLMRFLRSRYSNPKFIPTPYLKRLWTNWTVPGSDTKHSYEQAGGGDDDMIRQANRMQQGTLEAELAETQAQNGTATATTTAGVDRNTSVRSIMTLPVYRPKAIETEQVIGREGERDGIDVVVEMPTAEDEEAMREQEMNALYQIRAARRRQIAEREERRRLRREAREANNLPALQDLREQARGQATRNNEEIEELRQGHERVRESRQRAVSSVSYGDLGVVRADGTRLRANSTESERIGLLSDAASIAASTTAPTLSHRRERSGSSALSIDTARSNEHPESLATLGSAYSLASTSGATRSRANSGANTPRASSTRAGSSPEIIDAEDVDLGDNNMPPPGYDEVSLDELTPAHSGRTSAMSGRNSPYNEPPPEYPGPSQARNNRLSAHMDDLAAQSFPDNAGHQRSPSGAPRLPNLRLDQLPQIVIEPSSARP